MPMFLTTTDADFEERFAELLNMKREDSPDVDAAVAEIIALLGVTPNSFLNAFEKCWGEL